jgi:hypothetical protein
MKTLGQRDGPVANMQARQGIVRDNKVTAMFVQIASTDVFPECCSFRQVYNGAGQLYAVVHQYDRDPAFQKYLFGKVCDIDGVRSCVMNNYRGDVILAVC